MLAEARQRGIAAVDNEVFATTLAARHKVGAFIAADLFEMAARALIAARSAWSRRPDRWRPRTRREAVRLHGVGSTHWLALQRRSAADALGSRNRRRVHVMSRLQH